MIIRILFQTLIISLIVLASGYTLLFKKKGSGMVFDYVITFIVLVIMLWRI